MYAIKFDISNECSDIIYIRSLASSPAKENSMNLGAKLHDNLEDKARSVRKAVFLKIKTNQ